METKTIILVHTVNVTDVSRRDKRREKIAQYNDYIDENNTVDGLEIINYVLQGDVNDVKCIYPETLLPDNLKMEEIENILKRANDICTSFFSSKKDIIDEIEKWIDYKECPPKNDDVLMIVKGKFKMLGENNYKEKIFGVVKNKDLKNDDVRGYSKTRDIITEYRYLNYCDSFN